MDIYKGIEDLEHVILCLPGSGAAYFAGALKREGHICSHEGVCCVVNSEDEVVRVVNLMEETPRSHVSHSFTRHEHYELRPFAHCQRWVLVRDPLHVALSCMIHSNSGFVTAAGRVAEFYEKFWYLGKERFIYVDRPGTWFEFDSEKDYADLPKGVNPHNGGLINIDSSRLKTFSRNHMRVADLMEVRRNLGYPDY